MNAGDMSNADLGIAMVDAEGAEGRLKEGHIEEQISLTESTMNERTLGYILCVSIVVLGIIWALDVATVIQYGVTAAVAFSITLLVLRACRTKARLKALRSSQLEAYTKKN